VRVNLELNMTRESVPGRGQAAGGRETLETAARRRNTFCLVSLALSRVGAVSKLVGTLRAYWDMSRATPAG